MASFWPPISAPFCWPGGYLAIGSCLSALTRNQVIAFVISVVACFLFTVSGAPLVLELFEGWAPQALVETLATISLLTHFRAIAGGVIDARDVYFFRHPYRRVFDRHDCHRRYEKRRGRDAQSGYGLAEKRLARHQHGAALVLLLIFVSLNLFSNIAAAQRRLDLTQNQLFTLSQGTRNILAKLDEPVVLKFYYSQEQAAEQPQIRIFASACAICWKK